MLIFRNLMCFYGEELLAPRPTPKLEDHPLSAVRDCLFNIFATTLHIGGRSSIRNQRTHHTVVKDPLIMEVMTHIMLIHQPHQLVNLPFLKALIDAGWSQDGWSTVVLKNFKHD